MAKNYIPSNDAEFDRWIKFLIDYTERKCSGSPPAWDHIPAAARTGLADAYAVWAAASAAALGPHTPQETREKNRVRASVEHTTRGFVNRYLRFPPVTDEDRDNMGIPNRDFVPTPTPKPEDVPEVEVSTPLPRTLRFRFRRIGSKRWGKPEGVHGLELLWIIADAPPVKLDGFPHSAFSTRNPLELAFEEDQRGKRVYFAARWETGTVKKGPESDIFNAIIP
ncbi:MAG: hypothetical protein LBD58_06695 [Treponema sp.]|nr:hypothetical protein [Treponema sp.]